MTFDDGTRFRVAGGEDITFDDFVTQVQAALGAGIHPAVKAERDPPASPQAPDDPAFHATELRLDTDLEQPEIELNVDRDNLRRNDAPPPDGWLTLLGLEIELRVSEGITEIEVERPDVAALEFEGVVTSVDLDEGSFRLDDGTVVKLVDRTEMVESDEHAHRLRRLAAVKEAIEEGLTIVAWGKGAIESTDPLVLVALHVAFEVDRSTLEEFHGVIASVDVEARSLTLEDGTVIRLIGLTHFALSDGWHLSDDLLRRVAEAMANGHRIATGGVGVVVGEDPLTFIALKIRFALAPPPLAEFGGVVVAVDVDANSFTLENGTVVVLPSLSETDGLNAESTYFPRWNLQDVVDAMHLGLTVHAAGAGVVVAE
ncbi:MAG: hypothetical protein R3246_16410, partial [Acidimicrobiia bacterium]|nr:hypothetical protein [Acidimicrobiia bacterium]